MRSGPRSQGTGRAAGCVAGSSQLEIPPNKSVIILILNPTYFFSSLCAIKTNTLNSLINYRRLPRFERGPYELDTTTGGGKGGSVGLGRGATVGVRRVGGWVDGLALVDCPHNRSRQCLTKRKEEEERTDTERIP